MNKLEREYVNYCRLHPSKPIEWTVWHDAAQLGYAEGLKAGRYEVAKSAHALLSEVEKHHQGRHGVGNKIRREIESLWRSIAAFNKGGDDEA